ncbi:signal peptide peptidase SppA [Metabacillus fastidiosus]|uniref:signal peptide peptidase SppA n=1 Tax=Metabacillus fastidiosus TaxID=1458 RepID=UPI003D278839
MNGKRWGALIIAGVLFVFSSIISVTMFFFNQQQSFADIFASEGNEFAEDIIEKGDEFNKIAVLDVNGVIQDTGEDVSSIFAPVGYNHQNFLKMIKAAGEDEDVKGIIVRVNSPGGGVVESAEIHKELMKLKKETKKPIYISMGSIAASGGYYISTAADKIYATPETLTGSLGVIMQGINYGELAERYGVKFETIKSGEYKDIMSPTREMTADERKILQTMVNNSYKGFVDVISAGRKMSESEVRKVADGRIYDGRQAKQLNLIDGLGYFDDTVTAMKKDLKLEDAQVVSYSSGTGFGSFLSMSTKKMLFKEDSELAGLYRLLSTPNSPRLMYLYSE